MPADGSVKDRRECVRPAGVEPARREATRFERAVSTCSNHGRIMPASPARACSWPCALHLASAPCRVHRLQAVARYVPPAGLEPAHPVLQTGALPTELERHAPVCVSGTRARFNLGRAPGGRTHDAAFGVRRLNRPIATSEHERAGRTRNPRPVGRGLRAAVLESRAAWFQCYGIGGRNYNHVIRVF